MIQMRRINLLSGVCGCLIFLLSCSTSSTELPLIKFISPEVDTIHDLTTELEVEIDIFDDIMIEDYTFWLQSASGLEYYSEYKDNIKQSDFTLKYRFDLSKNINNDFTIHLKVSDNDGNTVHKQLKVTVYQ